MNFAAVVGASLRSSSALLRDAPTTAYYNVNRQRLHLSRAKHCLDEASHLSGRRRGIALNRIRLHTVCINARERRRAEWHKVAVAEDGRADGLRPSWRRAVARGEIRPGAGLWLRADCGCADLTWHGPVSWQRRRIQLGRRGRHTLLGGSEGAIGTDHAYSGTGSAAQLPPRVSQPSSLSDLTRRGSSR